MKRKDERKNLNPEISVVILCYQEGRRIQPFVDRTIKVLDDLQVEWEIILVANYWENRDDETPKAAEEAAAQRNNIKVIAKRKEGGMGWDARHGFQEATGNFICLIDGDGQMPPEDIANVFAKIKQEKHDLVMTYRATRGDSRLRKINSYVYNVAFRTLFPRVRVRDANAKPKILTRAAYSAMRLTSDDWFLDAELLIQCARKKLSVAEIPCTFDKCVDRKSYVQIDAVLEFIKNLLRARLKEFFIRHG
jgi:glycosyltransferase involved in cell wall biosynthesis